MSRKDGKTKKTKRAERIDHAQNAVFLRNNLRDARKEYTYHRYQLCNDKYEWGNILTTVQIDSPIYHMDYSENLQITPKYEPQSAHFNKKQVTLHCTVAHTLEEGEHLNKFIYHLSDDNEHDNGFTFTVIGDLINFYPECEIYRFKSDNCSGQYKCLYVFHRYKSLAQSLNKTIIIYFGVSGHGKGLVDAMSGFGMKNPLRKAMITNNAYFQAAM